MKQHSSKTIGKQLVRKYIYNKLQRRARAIAYNECTVHLILLVLFLLFSFQTSPIRHRLVSPLSKTPKTSYFLTIYKYFYYFFHFRFDV